MGRKKLQQIQVQDGPSASVGWVSGERRGRLGGGELNDGDAQRRARTEKLRGREPGSGWASPSLPPSVGVSDQYKWLTTLKLENLQRYRELKNTDHRHNKKRSFCDKSHVLLLMETTEPEE